MLAVLAAPLASAAQTKPARTHRIGVLFPTTEKAAAINNEAFTLGLRERGFVEGRNVVIERRYGQAIDEIPKVAAELVRTQVDVIVTITDPAIAAVKRETQKIPIVMVGSNDPVGTGFVASLARPGGNITGLSTLAPEISGKRLELLKEIVPRLSRLAVLGTSTTTGTAQVLKELEIAAGVFKVELQYLDVSSPKDVETAFREARKGRADAVLVLQGGVFNFQRKQIAALAVKSRLPAIYHAPEWVEDGGLMSYGVSVTDLYRRAATYVDKILKGAKPADLPVEQPTKFESSSISKQRSK